jgi:hypothetical protein
MPFHSKALSAVLSIIAAAAVTAPGQAQQNPPAAAQEGAPNASPQAPGTGAPTTQAPVRGSRAKSAAVISSVNLRSGPGTDQEIIATIPAGSRVRVDGCTGEWCEVTWNGQSGYAIARNLSIGAPRQARPYGPQPGYAGGYGPPPGTGGYGPGAGGYGPQPGAGGYGPQPGAGGYGPQPGAGGYGPQRGYPGGYGPESGYPGGYGPEPPAVYQGPGYYSPPAVVYGPAYYGPGVYYGPGWGWRRGWW